MNKKLAIPMAAVMLATQLKGITMVNAAEKLTRISGDDRFDTSVQVSKKTFNKSEYVILASGEKYQDALSGSVLAGYLNAPVLLTKKESLPKTVEDEINRLGAKKIYILGGENSVSKNILDSLSKKYEVERIAGDDRYETSMKIANKLIKDAGYSNVSIASGKVFADALSAAPAMAKNKMPIILTDGNKLPNIEKEKIKYIIGGESTIKAEGLNVQRIAGKDRYETYTKVAEKFFKNPSEIVLTSGQLFPDALSASSYSIKKDAPIILSDKYQLSKSVKDSAYLKDKNITIVGGMQTLSNNIENEIKTLLNTTNNNPSSSTSTSGGSNNGSSNGGSGSGNNNGGGGSTKPTEPTKDDSQKVKELKEQIAKIEKVLDRVDKDDVIIDNKEKTEVKEEIKNRLKELKEELKKSHEISDDRYDELKKELFSKHGVIADKGFYLKIDIEGEKTVKGKTDENSTAKYIRIKKNEEGKYVFKVISNTEGLQRDDGKDKKDPDKLKKYLKLNYVTTEQFNKEKDDNKIVGEDGNVDVISNPTPKYKKDTMPVENDQYTVKAVDGGYEVTINQLPENTLIVKPIIIDKLEDGSVLETGTLVFIDNANDASKNTPKGKDIKALVGDTLKDEDAKKAISNSSELKNVESYSFKEIVDTSSEGEKKATVVVTYKDGSKDEVEIAVNIQYSRELHFEVNCGDGDGEECFPAMNFFANDIDKIKEAISVDNSEKIIDFAELENYAKNDSPDKEFLGWKLSGEEKVYTSDELKKLSIETIKDKFVKLDGVDTKELKVTPVFKNKIELKDTKLEKQEGRWKYSFIGKTSPNAKISIEEQNVKLGKTPYKSEGFANKEGIFKIDVDVNTYKEWVDRAKLPHSPNKEIPETIDFKIKATDKVDESISKETTISPKIDRHFVIIKFKDQEVTPSRAIKVVNLQETDAVSSPTMKYIPGDKIKVTVDKNFEGKIFREWQGKSASKIGEENKTKNEFEFTTSTDVNETPYYYLEAIYESPKSNGKAPKMADIVNDAKSSNGTIAFKGDNEDTNTDSSINENNHAWINDLFIKNNSKITIKKNDKTLAEQMNSKYSVKENEYYRDSQFSKKLIFKGLNKGDKISILVEGYEEGVYYYDGNKLVDEKPIDENSNSIPKFDNKILVKDSESCPYNTDGTNGRHSRMNGATIILTKNSIGSDFDKLKKLFEESKLNKFRVDINDKYQPYNFNGDVILREIEDNQGTKALVYIDSQSIKINLYRGNLYNGLTSNSSSLKIFNSDNSVEYIISTVKKPTGLYYPNPSEKWDSTISGGEKTK